MHLLVRHLQHLAVVADDEHGAHRLPLAAVAADLDRQVNDEPQRLERDGRLQASEIAGRQLGQVLGEVDEADRIDHRPLVDGIDGDDAVPRLQQVVGNRLQQGLAELQLARLRLVNQRDQVDFVLFGGLLDVGFVARDDQPDLPQVLTDRGEIEGDLGENDQRLGVVFDGNAARGNQQAPHLL